MKARPFEKPILLLFVLLTAINAVIFIYRDHFKYHPYTSYNSLYSNCDESCKTKWSGLTEIFTKDEIQEANDILISNTDIRKEKGTLEKIQIIAAFIYNKFHAQYGRPSDSVMSLSALKKYKLLLESPNEKIWCGDFASMVLLFSRSQNILCRVIEIYSSDDQHVINECYVPELKQWMLVDVTYNTLTALSNTRQYLNVQNFRKLVNSDDPVFRISSMGSQNRFDTLDKNQPFLLNYFKPDNEYYYYYSTDLKAVYKLKEKLKRYFLPVSWYALYKNQKKGNEPFYFKIFFSLLWTLTALLTIGFYFRRGISK